MSTEDDGPTPTLPGMAEGDAESSAPDPRPLAAPFVPSGRIEQGEVPSPEEVGLRAAGAAVTLRPEQYCPVHLERVEVLLPATHAVMVLREVEGLERAITIPIALTEASAIAIAQRHLSTPRPFTHELFAETLVRFQIVVETLRISGESNGVFSAELVCSGPSGTRVLDCRPSDGVALALRQGLPAPMTVAATLLDRLGVPAG